MFDQLFSRRNSEVEHTSPTRESGTPVSPHMPISQCIAGEVAGIGISIGYCDSPPPIISVESIVAAKPWYEDFPDYSLISVGPRDGNEEEHSSAGHTRGWNASGFLAAICGIGIALSFWTPRNLWVIMGGFGLRREKRQQKSREQVRVRAREDVYAHERIGTRSGGKGKQRAIEASESEGESSTTLGESTPLLVGPHVPSYNKIDVYDPDEEPKPTFNRGDLEPVPVSPVENLLTTIEEDIEPRSLPKNSGFQLPERKLQTEQPILEGPEAAEVATPDSEGQCPFHVRKNSLQIQPLPVSIVIPTGKPASIRRPRSEESIVGSPPKDSPASSYRSRSLPRAFAMRDASRRREEEEEEEEKEKKVEEPQAMEPELAAETVPEHIQAEKEENKEKEDKEETPVFNLIPATPAAIPEEVRDAAEAAMKEAQDDKASSEEDKKDHRKTLSDSASIRSRKHSRANSLSDLREEPEESAAPARENSGSLTVDYKGKQPATSDEDDISIVDHPVSASPDQLSINEEVKKTEEPKPAPVVDSPSHGPPPSRGGSIMDDGKSISSQDPKSSPSRKGSFRRMVSGLPTRQPSNDAMKREGSLRRSLTSVIPGGKSKKRDKSAPPSSASSQILKLDTEAPAGSKSTTDVREAIKPPSESINTASPVKPDETPAVSPVAGPSSDDAQSTREEEKPKPASRRSSWWGISKELKRKNSIAKSDKGEEVTTRPATATSTTAPVVAPATPEGKGKEVERPAEVTTEASPAPPPAPAIPTEGVAKSDAPAAIAEPATTETPATETPAAAAASPPKPMLKERVERVKSIKSFWGRKS
ncbi:unnamed protein product [Tuber melanosporum]|uniref:(Perigord truffle) hypothetical protein n=1 Tax=Tuber melanosporum (strain Mel28) TaxID=656061 RepID=D5G4K7_TUBMM|nr:uncharacterized protein GSTUM_00004200001 [Tuber melanosporum]CAZ79450.1 unnamed protein product [Tuber melanosporum]